MEYNQKIINSVKKESMLWDLLTNTDNNWTLFYCAKLRSKNYFTVEVNRSQMAIIGVYDKDGDYLTSQTIDMSLGAEDMLHELEEDMRGDCSSEILKSIDLPLIESFRREYLRRVLSHSIEVY